MGTGSFPGVKRPRRDADPSPVLVLRSKQSRAIPLLSLRAFVAYKKGETYLLGIKGLYIFRALPALPQEDLHKRHLVCCVRVTSVEL
jgi:hypothetical protein